MGDSIIVIILLLVSMLGVCFVLAWVDYLFGKDKKEDDDG